MKKCVRKATIQSAGRSFFEAFRVFFFSQRGYPRRSGIDSRIFICNSPAE